MLERKAFGQLIPLMEVSIKRTIGDKEMKSSIFIGIMLASLLLMLSISMAQTGENNTTLPANNSTEINLTLPDNASLQDNQTETAEEAPAVASSSASSSC
jgi:hypothetical protein